MRFVGTGGASTDQPVENGRRGEFILHSQYATHTSRRQIIDIVRRSLSYVDRRLVDHGERVAYIADRIASMDAGLGIQRETLLILCLLHDIGAYKTEEIDDLVRFETADVTNHAVFGYVFLHGATVLGEQAEAILYHHTRYDEFARVDSRYKTYAQLIFLADRVDILLLSSGVQDFSSLRRQAGTVFSPQLTELFFAAEEKYRISECLRDLSYQQHVSALIEQLCPSQAEVMSYLRMLVYSIDFRSPFTVTHTANTSAISVALSELFDLGDDQREAIALGAFLHDIGKLAIPDSILESPNRLSEAQMAVMRTHVAVSEEILQGVVSDEVCQIAVRHHEKLDGSGYCHALTAPQLTLAQRIVAVADVLSALINRRSYKEAFSKEQALGILVQMRDAGELCPRVCDMVIENYDHILRTTDLADDPVVELYETIRRQYAALTAATPSNAD